MSEGSTDAATPAERAASPEDVEPRIDAGALAALADEAFEWRAKGFPLDGRYRTPRDVRAARPRVPGDEFSTPIAVLSDAALSHNLESMAAFCAEHGVRLAPHGKTTMAPQLYERQLAAGAWGITVATPWQLRVARAFGIRRLMLANELTDPAALRWLAGEVAREPDLRVLCYVDSVDGVERLDAALRQTGGTLDVLVEVGVAQARTGVRTREQGLAIARAVSDRSSLRLVGVSTYEGLLGHEASPEVLEAVHALLARVRALADDADADDLFDPREPVILSAGGSAFFDAVVQRLPGPLSSGRPVEVVLRSGAYLSHDSGRYDVVSPFSRGAGAGRLRPAIAVWSRVLSRPEPGRAVIDVGRRDVPADAGLPVVGEVVRADDAGRLDGSGLTVTALNDQHGYVDVTDDHPLAPGDLLRLGISHPCTFFDKWTWLPLVDEDDRAIDVIRTFF